MQAMILAELDGWSECVFINFADDADAALAQLLPVGNLAFSDEKSPPLMLPPGYLMAGSGAGLLQAPRRRGWRRLGLVGMPEVDSSIFQGRQGHPVQIAGSQNAWLLFFDWRARRHPSAWQTFLTTQEKLKPRNMSLLPQFILPLIFVTRMQDRITSGEAARWLTHFDFCYRHTFPLVMGLFGQWVLARRSTAARRQYQLRFGGGQIPESDAISPDSRAAAAVFTDHFPAQSEALLAVERWEPAFINTINAISADLWFADTPPVSRVEDEPLLKALLPLALWAENSEGPAQEVLQNGPDQLVAVWDWWHNL